MRKERLVWKKYTVEEFKYAKEKMDKFLEFYNNQRPYLEIAMTLADEIAFVAFDTKDTGEFLIFFTSVKIY